MKEFEFIQYRKLKNIKLKFTDNINIIAGTNGTCKSSILHLISNSYKPNPDVRLNNDAILKMIKSINKIFNPKIESLTRGDKEYNDPAIGVSGTLFTTKYDTFSLDFRRHNTRSTNNQSARFAIKPQYRPGQAEKLPWTPIIYLGLSRLLTYGEWTGEDKLSNKIDKLPDQYLNEICNIYKNFTDYEISFNGKMNDFNKIKNKAEFSTTNDGIDSNTISAGEDNLLTIIISLVSLKALYETQELEYNSILLIDEIDASLHPEFQIKLLKLFKQYSEDYKIQVFFTTHSFSLIEYSLDKKIGNLIYLVDQVNKVDQLTSPTMSSINALLRNDTVNNINQIGKIPIILEDEEANIFFDILLDIYDNNNPKKIRNFFHIVEAKLSCQAIMSLAKDTYLRQSSLNTIYIVDGDFDMIVHRENMILDTPEFIYLKSYNIENYLIDEKAILGFAKGKLKQVDEFVARKIDFQGWKQRIIREASKLFLCYCFIQKQKIDEKNVSRSPYEFIDKKTGFERTDEAYMQYYKHIKNISDGKIDEGIREIDSIVREIYNGDYFNIICGKFLLASLGCYLRAKIKERIDNDTLQWELILNFDINKLDFIKAVILQTPPSRAV